MLLFGSHTHTQYFTFPGCLNIAFVAARFKKNNTKMMHKIKGFKYYKT